MRFTKAEKERLRDLAFGAAMENGDRADKDPEAKVAAERDQKLAEKVVRWMQ